MDLVKDGAGFETHAEADCLFLIVVKKLIMDMSKLDMVLLSDVFLMSVPHCFDYCSCSKLGNLL